MFAALSALVVAFAVTAFLPITVSVFAYAFVEARHRRAWIGLARPAVRVGNGPYRVAEIVPSRLLRAPLLVRAAALGCFYWSWFCLVTWAGVGVMASTPPPIAPLAVLGAVVATCVGRAGIRILRRDSRAVAFGRRVALGAVVHASFVVILGFAVGGCDWSAPAAVFAVVSLGQATLLALALRHHAPLFAQSGSSRPPDRPLPTWLARVLARQAQRRANFLASASTTRAGA